MNEKRIDQVNGGCPLHPHSTGENAKPRSHRWERDASFQSPVSADTTAPPPSFPPPKETGFHKNNANPHPICPPNLHIHFHAPLRTRSCVSSPLIHRSSFPEQTVWGGKRRECSRSFAEYRQVRPFFVMGKIGDGANGANSDTAVMALMASVALSPQRHSPLFHAICRNGILRDPN